MLKTLPRQLLISGIILLSSAAVPLQAKTIAEEFSYEDVIYFVTNRPKNTAEVIGYEDDLSGDLVIPSTVSYEGVDFSVTAIKQESFEYCQTLTSVVIPNTVKSMGSAPFRGCPNLKAITVDGATDKTGYYSIDGVLFNQNCLVQVPGAIKNYDIPEGTTSIADCAFEGCWGLYTVSIPESVESIGSYAFFDCFSLTDVKTSGRVSKLGERCFVDCFSLTSFDYSWVEQDYIPSHTFEDCRSLASIKIPATVNRIDDGAFNYCGYLSNIYVLAKKPPFIEGDCFEECPSDAVVYVPEGTVDMYKAADSWSYVSDFREIKPIIINMQSDLVIEKGKKITITPGVQLFEAEKSTEKWTSSDHAVVTVNDEGLVTAVGIGTSTLTLTINDTAGHTSQATCQVKVIGRLDFDNLDAMGEEFSDSDNKLRYRVISEEDKTAALFGYDDSFEGGAVTIPSMVEHNGKTYSVISVGKSVFGMWDSYPDREHITSINIPNSVVAICDSAFTNCYNLVKVNISNSVVYIGNRAFDSCELAMLNIPNSVTHIGDGAFDNNLEFFYVHIPVSVSSIGCSPFAYCENLMTVLVDEDNQYFCSNADGTVLFNKDKTEIIQSTKWYARKEYTIPPTVKKIWESAFDWEDYTLKTLIIPASVNEIDERAFFGNGGLSMVKVYAEVPPTLGDDAFGDCAREVLYVPAGTKEAYEAAEGWNEFKEIREMDENSIERVDKTVDSPEEYFNLHGERMLGDLLPQGIYIKRHNGKSSKIYVR